MKKYLLGLFAVALAIGFSAFTSAPKAHKATNQTQYYWYHVNGANYGSIIDAENLYSQEEFITAQLDCTLTSGVKCDVGSSSATASGTLPPDNGDNFVFRTP